MNAELREALDRVARRARGLRLWTLLAACWLAWAATAALAAYASARSEWEVPQSTLVAAALAAAATAAACVASALRSGRDRREAARRVEARYPDLAAGLLAAVEQAPGPDGRRGYLQIAVVRRALEHRQGHDWDEAVSTRSIRGAQAAHASALVLCLAVAYPLVGRSRPDAAPATAIALDVKVEPGDAEVERGAPLLVVARFPGAVPADAELVVEAGEGSEVRLPMSRALDDPMFAARIASVAADAAYRVEFGGRRTRDYRVTVFEYPELRRADANLAFPEYTRLAPRTVEDVRHVTAVEGTDLTLVCRLNKPVARARLVAKGAPPVALEAEPGESTVYRASMTLDESRRYALELVDADGRAAKDPAEIAVNVTKNRPPAVKMARPGRDVRVSPVEELTVKATVEDDFGVLRRGVSYALGGGEPREVVLDGPEEPIKAIAADHMIDFESLRAEPDQLVSYFVWAEDAGPDGNPRRTAGDMFFAEVRHFEEIFRQGEAPAGGQQRQQQGGGNARQAEQLAELQKQIINGTWTLLRREAGSKPSPKLAGDAKVLAESQRQALGQAEAMSEQIEDATSKADLDRATQAMRDAGARLDEAIAGPSSDPLTPALAAEQAAYQALLKLRAREFEVTRGQRNQGGGGGGGGPSQRQLSQLELSADENRYEQQSSAESGSPLQQALREDHQVMNRLRELSQRQADLNERLKEMQAALEAAKDEQAREEIERQLKRLRDQQREVLRDADELRERMEREENRDRMADAREQLEQGRERVRQASEALEDGRLSQAITEGTRAREQMDDLREEIRRNSAGRFSEELAGMREQARQLAEDQRRLTEQLENQAEQPARSLRDDDGRRQAREDLARQREGLDDLLDRMKQTVEQAEETEPRLARELFDAARAAERNAVGDALREAEALAGAGIGREAAESSRRAEGELDRLREGVERAASSVLGDEAAALRLARGELDDLADQVDRELAEAAGRRPGVRESDGEDREPDGQPGDGRGRDPDERKGQDREPGEGRGRGEPSDRQEGDARDGGEQQGQGGQQGEQPGEAGQEGEPEGQGAGRGRPEGQPGQGQGGQGEPSDRQGGQGGRGPLRGGEPRQGGGNRDGGGLGGMLDRFAGGGVGPGGPITGEGFREWSDRMRDVEELLDDPELRAEAARIRDRVRGAREEFRRHSRVPDWTKLQSLVADPLHELRDRVAEEARRRESPDALVPIDRDPVPPRFAEGVRRYYERLGSGR